MRTRATFRGGSTTRRGPGPVAPGHATSPVAPNRSPGCAIIIRAMSEGSLRQPTVPGHSASVDDVDPAAVAAARWEWAYRAAVVVAVAPILIWAVRFGLAGWEPSWDLAITTVRIRDVFSSHPPLVGMAARPSSSGGTAYSFPGALHLYLLAGPVRVLGTTWGIALGMGVINTAMGVGALWLVRRRLGARWAIVAALTFATLVWSLGGAAMIDATPLVMGVVALFTFLVAAWSVADGDGPALLLFAFVANYLFLDQLVFIVVVGLVGAVAFAWVLAARWRARRAAEGPPSRADTMWRRWLLAAVALTVVVWIPTLVDQFVVGGGNLGHIAESFRTGDVAQAQDAQDAPTLKSAFVVVSSVVAVVPGWLPPSFIDVPFDEDGSGPSLLVGVVATLAWLALLAWGAVRAHRRRDARVGTAIVIAVTGWVAYLITALQNPSKFGYVQRYFFGLWPFGAFLWLVAAVGVFAGRDWRRVRIPRVPVLATGSAGVALVVVTVFSVSGPLDTSVMKTSVWRPLADDVRQAVARADLGPGPVLVETTLGARRYHASALLGMQDAGVPFRVRLGFDIEQYGAWRAYDVGDDTTERLLISMEYSPKEGRRLIATIQPEASLPPDEFDGVDRRIRAWADRVDSLSVNPAYPMEPEERRQAEGHLDDAVEEASRSGTSLADSELLIHGVRMVDEGTGEPLIAVPGVSASEARAWATDVLTAREPVYIYVEPLG